MAARVAAGFGRGLVGFGRGSVRLIRPAVFPLAALGGGALLVNQVGDTADNIGRAVNPPLQQVPVDTTGDSVPDSYVLFDPKTGLQTTFGQRPVQTQENDRQEVQKLGLIIAGAAAIAVAALAFRK